MHRPTGGAAIVYFTVAANDGRYDPVTGEWVDKGPTFLRCSIGGQAAENVAESLTKGARVLVTGMLRQHPIQGFRGRWPIAALTAVGTVAVNCYVDGCPAFVVTLTSRSKSTALGVE